MIANQKEETKLVISNVQSAQDLLTRAWKSSTDDLVTNMLKEAEIELIDLRIRLEALLRTPNT